MVEICILWEEDDDLSGVAVQKSSCENGAKTLVPFPT
jgi:hypothetical protein